MQKLSVLFLSLVVLFLFFAGFYLYYVPANKASLNRYGFLVLEQLESSMQYKYRGYDTLFGNYVRAGLAGDPRKRTQVNRALRNLGVDSVESKEEGLRSDHLYYSFKHGGDTTRVSVPIARFMADQLAGGTSDFFGSFVLFKQEGEELITMYKNAGVPIGKQIPTDSLLKGSKGAFYPGVADLHAGDLDYKLFYIPVALGNQRYVLCGIKDAAEYNEATHAVPAGFIYPIVITLLLLLIVSPLIKLYIMGPAEKMRLRDFTGYCFALVAGSMVVTLIVIQVLLLRDGDERQDQRLHALSAQMNGAFQDELVRAYKQLVSLDSLPLRPDASGRVRDWRHGYFDVSREVVDYMSTHRSEGYFNWDRVDWVSDSGKQVINGSLQKNLDTLYVEVSKRKYYTDFLNNSCVTLPGLDTALVSVQPVVTWTEGAARMVIAKRSVCPDVFIATLSCDLYSVNRTILPSGFGFCLIDADGRVQVHSDPVHPLNENFVDEVADAAQLRAAMKARQELYLAGTKFYARDYGVMVKPVANLPFFLVVYYDKGYIQPVNMRILIFSLAGCGMVLFVFITMWFLFFRRRWSERPLLFGVMDYLPWIVPRETSARIYRLGWLVLMGYVLVTTVAVTSSFYYGPGNNQRVLALLLLTPLLVSAGLKIIIKMPREKFSIWRKLAHPFAHLLHYCLLVETLVLATGVLPAALFTWYANNQELMQSVKKEQFLLAGGLDARKPVLYRNLQVLDSGVAPRGLFADWQYNHGIYSYSSDRLNPNGGPLPPRGAQFGVAGTYFEVAGWLANDYYDPEYVPVLQGGSDDHRWLWTKPKNDTMHFYYGQDRESVLQISSVMPQRYYYLSSWSKGFLLLLVVLALLYGLFKLIRRISSGIFLQKFVVGERLAGFPCYEEYCLRENLAGDDKEARLTVMRAEIISDLHPRRDDAAMDAWEIEILHVIRKYDGYFALVLSGCNAKEKYLLFQFACNGFLNYKNVVEIDHLLERGVLVVENEEVRLFSRAFRAYILTHVNEDELERSFIRRSAWQRFRVPFLILLMIAAAFLFFTRQEAWQRISALIAALSTSLGLLSGLFKDGLGGARGVGSAGSAGSEQAGGKSDE